MGIAIAPSKRPEARGFRLSSVSRKLSIGDLTVKLTPHELRFMQLLLRRRGRLLSRHNSCQRLWGVADESAGKRLDTLVQRLREKLAATQISIVTVKGHGHRMVPTYAPGGATARPAATPSGRSNGVS
jgi:DNA-binding response OmpR family regulator